MAFSTFKPVLLVCGLLGAAPGWADDAKPASATETTVDDTLAEVRRIDRASGKITLKHGHIKQIDMPPMTMVFAVKDPAQLDGLKVGDKVRFALTPELGRLEVMRITLVR